VAVKAARLAPDEELQAAFGGLTQSSPVSS
jgi:hypothetical protein